MCSTRCARSAGFMQWGAQPAARVSITPSGQVHRHARSEAVCCPSAVASHRAPAARPHSTAPYAHSPVRATTTGWRSTGLRQKPARTMRHSPKAWNGTARCSGGWQMTMAQPRKALRVESHRLYTSTSGPRWRTCGTGAYKAAWVGWRRLRRRRPRASIRAAAAAAQQHGSTPAEVRASGPPAPASAPPKVRARRRAWRVRWSAAAWYSRM